MLLRMRLVVALPSLEHPKRLQNVNPNTWNSRDKHAPSRYPQFSAEQRGHNNTSTFIKSQLKARTVRNPTCLQYQHHKTRLAKKMFCDQLMHDWESHNLTSQNEQLDV